MATFDHTQIARLATGLYATQIGNTTMQWALDSVNGHAYGSVAGLANALYARDFAGMSDADLAARVVANVGITGADQVAEATAIVTGALGAAAAGQKGQAVLDLINAYANLTAPEYADAVAGFNKQIAVAEAYAKTLGTADVPLAALTPVFHLDDSSTIAGLQSMHLTGNQDVRINLSNTANQITGLDLNGDGVIAADGVENKITGRASGFEAVDAYSRNPWNHKDTANNFLGDIDFDGRSYQGDGVKTNGNIVLGGLGGDTIYGGVGNDFLAGGGLAQGSVNKHDYLSGGRNADFFFAEFSAIGNPSASLEIDGGNTADDNSAGNGQSAQDSDWLLLEANDDDEPVQIWLNDDNLADQRDAADGLFDGKGRVLSRAGDSMVIDDIENVDASGNLYGFLNNIDVLVGKRAMDARDAGATDSNFGYGSAAQLWISGSNARNIIIGGYDNDYIEGRGGNDLLMGGNLNFNHDPNLSAIINNGRDELVGGAGDDNIVFETDGGIYEGGSAYNNDDDKDDTPTADPDTDSGVDTLWLTRETFGTQDAATVTADGFLRMDLGVGKEGGLGNYAGYGGADKAAATGRYTSDQTNYKAGYLRTQVQDMENVIATGLGAVDYKAAGANSPNNASAFDNQQNHYAYVGNLDLRGTTGVNTLYAAAGDDVIEGREGGTSTFNNAGVMTADGRDKLSGGDGRDDFYFTTSDGVDVIHRQKDIGNNLTDGTFERDFARQPGDSTTASSLTLSLPTGATANVAGISFLLGGTTYTVEGLASASYAAFTAALNASLDANAALAGLNATLNADNTVTITDPAGGTFAKNTVTGGWLVTGALPPDGTSSWQQIVGASVPVPNPDRLIYQAYEDRHDNERVDDQSYTGSTISLGERGYAEDLVIDFKPDANGVVSTSIAADQRYVLTFTNLTTEDKVTITVNDVKYTLTVGVDLDGNEIANEELAGQGGSAVDQAAIQANFLARMVQFINSFMDDDTAAGKLTADATGLNANTQFAITQAMYDGEETVFMRTPTVVMDNASKGEPATVTVQNVSEHEVELFQFDGRGGNLNHDNVLFWGDQQVNRSYLETGAGAAGTANTITGTDALIIDGGTNTLQGVIFGTTTTIADNTATNSFLRTDFTVHGDDFLLGGVANDTINAGTGDDRVVGSLGTDTIDGGKSYYAVQVLGEPQARVYLLNQWEASNPTKVTALQSLTISSINRIGDAESGNATPVGVGVAEVYRDTLQFEQRHFNAGTEFTVVLDTYVRAGAGALEFRSGGAGHVHVDDKGDGTRDATTTFTNFENIRTVSGTGNAVAGDGQGNDTLDVTLLSSVTTGAGGIYYNLTDDGGAGEVRYSKDAFITNVAPAIPNSATGDRPAAGDYEELVIKVDGVENILASDGNDLLRIDETEAAKNNRFEAGLGTDKVIYENDYDGGGATGVGQPSVTLKVNAGVDTDTVTMKGGRVGVLNTPSGGAVDTLVGVEYIEFGAETAQSAREDDVIDVTAMTAGAVVDYTNGEVRTSPTAGTGVQVVVENIVQFERVNADGNDLVIVADADVMNNNARSDELNATVAKNILFMTHLDFDDLTTGTTTRKSFSAQVGDGSIHQVINQGQFTFSLSEVGTDADVDRVDYSNELGTIIVPVGQGQWTVPGAATNRPQYVVVDGDSDNDLTDAQSRVDALYSVEEIVAAQSESVLDFTDVNQDRQITFQYVPPSANPADKQVIEQTIRIADGNGNTVNGLNTFVEKYTYDATGSLLAPVADATWNRIEGGDKSEVVIYQGSEDLVNQGGIDHRYTTDTLNLRGGNNEVRYSPLETSISLNLTVTEEDPATLTTVEGLISGVVTFQDGQGVNAPSGTFLGGMHTITSHTSDNATKSADGTSAAGNLKIEASQDAEDVVSFTSTSNKVFILGSSPGVVNVKIGALNTMTLTGFEFLQDPDTNDVYDIRSIAATAGLRLTDNGAEDHDAIRVANDSVNYNGSGPNTIDLDNISATVGGFNFDFDVLDLTNLTSALTALTVNGGTNAAPGNATDLDGSDEVVLGPLARVANIADFESMVLTDATVAVGSAFTFNPSANTLVQGSATVNTSANVLSFGGLVGGGAGPNDGGFATTAFGTSYVPAVATGVTVTIAGSAGAEVYGGAGADTITGGSAADLIRGGAGNDTLSGGLGTDVRTMQVVGVMDGAGPNTVTITFDGDGAGPGTYALTVTEGVEIVTGAGSAAVADALALKAMTNLTALNAAALWNGGAALQSVTSAGGILTFTFTPGVNVTGTITGAETDGGATFGITANASPVTVGGNGGADTFVFEPTAAANGADTINQVTVGLGGDVFDFSLFFGGASVLADLNGLVPPGYAQDFAVAGGNSLADGEVGIVFNKAGGLAASDIALAAATNKIAVPDNGKAVVLVTADVDGVGGDAPNSPYLVYYVQDTDTTGAQNYTVTLVGTVNSAVELNAADWDAANFA